MRSKSRIDDDDEEEEDDDDGGGGGDDGGGGSSGGGGTAGGGGRSEGGSGSGSGGGAGGSRGGEDGYGNGSDDDEDYLAHMLNEAHGRREAHAAMCDRVDAEVERRMETGVRIHPSERSRRGGKPRSERAAHRAIRWCGAMPGRPGWHVMGGAVSRSKGDRARCAARHVTMMCAWTV